MKLFHTHTYLEYLIFALLITRNMKLKTLSIIFLLAGFISLSSRLFSQGPVCDALTPGLIPLNDLGAGFYSGFQGGFYPSGQLTESPASQHFKKGKNFAKNMQPLNASGAVDYDNGVVLMAGFGPSVPLHLIDSLISIVHNDFDGYKTNPCFDLINLCIGGRGLDFAVGPDSYKYWDSLENTIAVRGYNINQLQVGWMYFNAKYDSLNPLEFPEHAINVKDDYITWLQLCKEHFPNMKIMFVSGRHYGGFCDTTIEQLPAAGEPASYYNNFTVKWLIEYQINNVPGLQYFGAAPVAPYVTWGPYFWTNGATPRITDGRSYGCEKFSDDGFHLTDETNHEDADYMMQHLYNSEYAKYYLKKGTKWNGCTLYTGEEKNNGDIIPDENGFTIYPNPASDLIYINNANRDIIQAVEIYDITGQLLYTSEIKDQSTTISIDIDFLHSGLYLLHFKSGDFYFARSFYKE